MYPRRQCFDFVQLHKLKMKVAVRWGTEIHSLKQITPVYFRRTEYSVLLFFCPYLASGKLSVQIDIWVKFRAYRVTKTL